MNMKIIEDSISKACTMLTQAEAGHKPIQPLTEVIPQLTVDMAYKIQLYSIGQKLLKGRKIIGKKIGLTSLAMQSLLGVHQPDYGQLLDVMEVPNKGKIQMKALFQPKVEAELAFVLKKTLSGPSLTVEDVLAATDYIVPSIEIVDSRIKDWKIKLEDTIADNASSGFFVLGDQQIKPGDINLQEVEMELFRNDQWMNKGKGTDVLGNPATCVAWLGNKLSEYGTSLKAGDIILSGALSAAIPAQQGDRFIAVFKGWGTVEVSFN